MGITAFLLVGGGVVSWFQAESQTRVRAETLGKQNDDEWQAQRVSRVKLYSGIALVLGVLVMLPPLLG